MRADRKETLRYLGYRGQELESETAEMIETIAAELEENSSPKSVYQEYDCKVAENHVKMIEISILS